MLRALYQVTSVTHSGSSFYCASTPAAALGQLTHQFHNLCVKSSWVNWSYAVMTLLWDASSACHGYLCRYLSPLAVALQCPVLILRYSRFWRWRQYGSPKRWYPTITSYSANRKTANIYLHRRENLKFYVIFITIFTYAKHALDTAAYTHSSQLCCTTYTYRASSKYSIQHSHFKNPFSALVSRPKFITYYSHLLINNNL
jgi:hypothetical protein